MSNNINTQVVVIGGGPGGYSAAFRCADLGLETILVERYKTLGGVCLNVGCIPSKALLHVIKVMKDFKILNENDIFIKEGLKINIDKLQTWKNNLINNLTNNLNTMAKMRNVKLINGYAKFIDANTIQIADKHNTIIYFKYAIIAVGSRSNKLSFISHDDTRIWNSTDALALTHIPKRLLIIGGGAIGLEMATIYHGLGSKIDIIEMYNQVIPSLDENLATFFTRQINVNFNLMLETKVTKIEIKEHAIFVNIEGKGITPIVKQYDAVLVAIGRRPNSDLININQTAIKLDKAGFILVDKQMCTSVSNIYAIGDVVGKPMLAHKAIHEGHIAAEVISGNKHYFNPKVIPSIAYSEPEVAWVGVTTQEANKKNINYKIVNFPWKASGRAISSNSQNGITMLIFDKQSHKLIGGGIVGNNASELLGEISLAIEMGCDAEDIALTIHAHPTLYESIGLAAEVYQGNITDLLNVKK